MVDNTRSLQGATQSIVDILNLGHDKELSLPRLIVEEYNFLLLLILDRSSTVQYGTIGDTRRVEDGNAGPATIFLCCNCCLPTPSSKIS